MQLGPQKRMAFMKVVAFNGSPRKEGNTAFLIKQVFQELEKEGIKTELVHLGSKPVRGCTACFKCYELKNNKCVFDDDIINSCIGKMVDADGIILGSPTYFCNVTTGLKALIDRAGIVAGANNNFLKRKVGAAVVSVRRAGAVNVFNSINYFFFIREMIVPGSTYWNMGFGMMPGDVKSDKEGLETMSNLGKNMAWLLKNLHR
jgi:multimeric flavodoxin WrbA